MQDRFSGLVTLGLVAAVATTGCYTRRRAAPPPRQAPPGYAQQAPGNAPPPAQPAWPWLAFRLPAPLPAPGIFRPVNVSALMGSLSRSPCRPHEMSPGNWIGFDCSPPNFVLGALPFQRTQQFTTSTGALPDAVDHRSNGMEGPVKNQGAVGTCTAVSLSTAMENALRIVVGQFGNAGHSGTADTSRFEFHLRTIAKVKLAYLFGLSSPQKVQYADKWITDYAKAKQYAEDHADDTPSPIMTTRYYRVISQPSKHSRTR